MLAIGTHILARVIDDPRVLKKIKLWDDFKAQWAANREAIAAIRDELDFLVPIEVLVPATNGRRRDCPAVQVIIAGNLCCA
jgi:hypothetical protein